jgi:hypothetical protein
MIEFKTIKNLIKGSRKTIKNQKKMDQIRTIIIIEKTKTIKDKIESHKKFVKRKNDKNKKLKVE